MGTFVVYIDNAGEFRWYLMAENSEKIAEFAPIPRASDRIATRVMNGDLNSVRRASLKLGIPVRLTEI